MAFFDKRFIYEESLRMPTVVSYPSAIEGNRQLEDIILNIDFPALLLDYAGLSPLPGMQGRSFRPNLEGNTPTDWRKAMYYRYWTNSSARPAHFGIRTEQYKLALFYGQSRQSASRDSMAYPPGWEFYDLLEDPLEQHNAIKDEKYQEEINHLKLELKRIKTDLGDHDTAYPIIQRIVAENWQ